MEATAAKLKVEQLIKLAVNPGASEAEARTAAFLAVKLLHSSGLKIALASVKSAPAPKAAYTKPAPSSLYVIMYTKFGGKCAKCGGWICKGTKVSYKTSSKKMRHIDCC